MNCKKYRNEIEDGGLDVLPSAEAQAHLHGCAGCRQFYAEQASLKRLVRELETVSAPADFEFRLRARLSARAIIRDKGGFFSRHFAPSAPSIALAACFALTVAVTLYLSRTQVTDTNGTRLAESTMIEAEGPPRAAPQTLDGSDAADSAVLESVVAVERTDKVQGSQPAAGRSPRFIEPARNVDGVLDGSRAESSGKTSDFGVGPARVVKSSALGMDNIGGEQSSITIPVRISMQPVKVLLRDERGTSRVVSLEPVTFGAQDFVKRAGGEKSAPLPSKEGVW